MVFHINSTQHTCKKRAAQFIKSTKVNNFHTAMMLGFCGYLSTFISIPEF